MTDGLGSAPGDVVGGRYRLDAVLGEGGMSVVWRATDLKLDRAVAVKVFRAEVAEAVDPQRTARESHLLAGVHHPAVVGALDASASDAPVTFLVLELVEGADLKTLLTRGALDVDLTRRAIADVADALALLHSRGVVHRDVKPANILVVDEHERDRTGITAKLTDFGIAQAVDGTRITSSDMILGTAAYLSPEQVRGETVGAASDVYSAGLVLLECLSGRRAFPGPPAEAALARLSSAPAIPPEVSPELAALLTAMTAIDPAARPAASEVAASLRGLAGSMTAPEAADTAPVPRPAPSLLAAVPAAALVADPAAALAGDDLRVEEADAETGRRHPLLVPAIAAATVALLGGAGALLSAPLLFGGGPQQPRAAAAATSGAAVPPGDAVTAGTPSADPTTPGPVRSTAPSRLVRSTADSGTGSGSSSSSAQSSAPATHSSPSPSSVPSHSASPRPTATPTSVPTASASPPASSSPTATTRPSPAPSTSRSASPAPTSSTSAAPTASPSPVRTASPRPTR